MVRFLQTVLAVALSLPPSVVAAADLQAAARKVCQHSAGKVTIEGPVSFAGRTIRVAFSRDDEAWAKSQVQPQCVVWLEEDGRVLAHGAAPNAIKLNLNVAVKLPGTDLPILTETRQGYVPGQTILYLYVAGREPGRLGQTILDVGGTPQRLRLVGRGEQCPQERTITYGLCGDVPVIDTMDCREGELARSRHAWNASERRFELVAASPPCATLRDPVVLLKQPVLETPDQRTAGLKIYGDASSRFVLQVDGALLVELPPQSAHQVLPLRRTKDVVAVQVSRMLGARTEEAVELYRIKDGARLASERLAWWPGASGCDPEAFLSNGLEVVSCGPKGPRVRQLAPEHLSGPLKQPPDRTRITASDLACHTSDQGTLCLGRVDDGETSAAWFIDVDGKLSGVPALYGVKVVDGPLWREGKVWIFTEATHGRPSWQEIALPARGEPKAVRVLEPLFEGVGGMAVQRRRLSTGAIIQMQASCSEFGGALGGFVVFPRRGGQRPQVVFVPTGQMQEAGGHLIIAGSQAVGGDGSGDSLEDQARSFPKGADLAVDRGNGAWEALRLTALNLKTRKVLEAGWDAYDPVTAGAGRFVVFRRYTGPLALSPENKPERLERWDLRTGRLQVLANLASSEPFRMSRGEVFALVVEEGTKRWKAIDGTTGAVRTVSSPPDAEPVRSQSATPASEVLAREGPGAWVTHNGEVIRVASGNPLGEPEAGMCGVPGFWFEDGVLYTDDGAYRWPRDLPPPPLGGAATNAR